MCKIINILVLVLLLMVALKPQMVTAQAITSGPSVNLSDSGRLAPEVLQNVNTQQQLNKVEPFGANLFKGRFLTDRENGLNPGYTIQQGDKINIQIWGATIFSQIVSVDTQGNIFIPEIGPIKVEGVTNSSINGHIESAIRQVYTQNVNVYTNLLAATPVIVFVTGFVKNPGTYAGLASDSILYFLDSAGGIDHLRGSFLNISMIRDGNQIESINLYNFLIDGSIPKLQFIDGDTILVEQRGSSIAVDGSARNTFNFEIPDTGITGEDLIKLTRPFPNSFYATILGTRNDQPFSSYIPLSELKKQIFLDGDQVTFEIDQFNNTMIIRVEGSHIGQSRFAVPRNTRLLDILNYIQVDPALSDTSSISLRRDSLRIRQAKSIQESLARLETAVLSKQSATSEGADIAVKEAQLITSFIEKARQVEPQGILVLANNGNISDILLQPNDIISIPDNTNVVQISGEVSVPQALVYKPEYSLNEYINMVGGYTERADEDKHLILRRTGEVIPLFDGSKQISIKPGDEIIAISEIPSNTAEIVQLVVETILSVTTAAAIFLGI